MSDNTDKPNKHNKKKSKQQSERDSSNTPGTSHGTSNESITQQGPAPKKTRSTNYISPLLDIQIDKPPSYATTRGYGRGRPPGNNWQRQNFSNRDERQDRFYSTASNCNHECHLRNNQSSNDYFKNATSSDPSSLSDIVHSLPSLPTQSKPTSASQHAFLPIQSIDDNFYCASVTKRVQSLNENPTHPHQNVSTLTSLPSTRKIETIAKVRSILNLNRYKWPLEQNSYSAIGFLASIGLRIEMMVGKLSNGEPDMILRNMNHMYRCVIMCEYIRVVADSSNSLVAKEAASQAVFKILNNDMDGLTIPIYCIPSAVLVPRQIVKWVSLLCKKVDPYWSKEKVTIERSPDYHAAKRESPTLFATTYIINKEHKFSKTSDVQFFSLLAACKDVYEYFTGALPKEVKYFVGSLCDENVKYDFALQDIPTQGTKEEDLWATEVNEFELESFEETFRKNLVLRNHINRIMMSHLTRKE